MNLWTTSQQHPESPPFTGGVLDAWPAYAVDSLGICRQELSMIRMHINREAKK